MTEKKPILTACVPAPMDLSAFDLDAAVDISEADQELYQQIVSTELSPEQRARVENPDQSYPRQKDLLAIHWHPEWIPMELTMARVEAMFPNVESRLVIPTQHNQLLTLGRYAGVEVDCYASGFKRKVQLLLHFEAAKVAEAGVLKSMLAHTFKYRTGQLFQFIDTLVQPEHVDDLEEAVTATGAGEEVVAFVRFYAARLAKLIDTNEADTPPAMIKNKLLIEFIEAQCERHPQINQKRALLLLKAAKQIVKRNFALEYFFRASQVIEEVRGLDGGVVIPHPEQFWPILLADYDVDGYEVWNPQSREYTEFLIKALTRKNHGRLRGRRELLIFMGDDCHLSVKIKDPAKIEPSKLEREVGLQPAWDELSVRKTLSLSNASRAQVIREYAARLQ